jgi:hypothetical protein
MLYSEKIACYTVESGSFVSTFRQTMLLPTSESVPTKLHGVTPQKSKL